ncbi:MAG: very short patch repair endonuclease [Acidobacteriota bacterium]|nr:very short patch repair endonuclease [Acidobacteriota bacterium]
MDTLSAERRSDNMRRIRSKDTSPEITVRKLVHGMGFRYRLHVARLPGKPDLVFARLKKIIEVRGCFWHQHNGCSDSRIPKSRIDYWAPKLARNIKRDRENERQLTALGWQVLTIWECELKSPASYTQRIRRFLSRVHAKSSSLRRPV